MRTLLDMDGADHRDHRNLTQSWFHSRFLDSLRDRMARLAREYVDKLETLGGECDFIEEIAVPYPLIMITTILGLPDSDAPLVLRLTQELFGAQDPERQRSGQYGQDVAMEFFGYLAGIVAERRKDPKEDLMSVVANATLHGEPLPDIDTLSYGMLLAAAGHDTTSSSVGIGMMQLAAHPDQFGRLQADPALIPGAAQEIFRWATPVRHFLRDIVTTIHGRRYANEDETNLACVRRAGLGATGFRRLPVPGATRTGSHRDRARNGIGAAPAGGERAHPAPAASRHSPRPWRRAGGLAVRCRGPRGGRTGAGAD